MNADFLWLLFLGAIFSKRGQGDFDARGRHLLCGHCKLPGAVLRRPPRGQGDGERDLLSLCGSIANPQWNHQRTGSLQGDLRRLGMGEIDEPMSAPKFSVETIRAAEL